MRDGFTWKWWRGRAGYELRWLPWLVKRVLKREARWYAPARTLWHALVRMYECEICNVCGHPVAAVWHAEDALWLKVMGSEGGQLCTSCFNRKAEAMGFSVWWEVSEDHYPSCTGNPCAHEKPMMIQAEAADEYWAALVAVTGSRDAARDAVDELRRSRELALVP